MLIIELLVGFVTLIVAILTTGYICPEAWKDNKLLRAVIATFITVSSVGTLYAVKEWFQPAPAAGVAAEAMPSGVNFVSLLEGLALPAATPYYGHAWEDIRRLLPGVAFPPDQQPAWIFQSCDKPEHRGRAKLFFGGKPVMDMSNESVAVWQVSACGPRAGVASVSFDSGQIRQDVQPSPFGTLYAGLKQDLAAKGLKVAYEGCEGGFSEGTSTYLVTRDNIKPFHLGVSDFANPSNATVTFTMSFGPVAKDPACTRRVDRLGIE